ncbi:hypothetical protein R3P38DRAFT_3494053 [Favolaschia claudopus]|uniref:Uncharacterized protein n=1 Tax=Favolaschia claudopus TaxID=2862362 RepID=A0AAW0C7J3_9AGAR
MPPWDGNIENFVISGDYAEFNIAHPNFIRVAPQFFVAYTNDANDKGVGVHASNVQVAIRHNGRLHNPDVEVKYNPELYVFIAEHLNAFCGTPRWYYADDDYISSPGDDSVDLPTLTEFMVLDSDIYDPQVLNGKVLVDIAFKTRALELMVDSDMRRQRGIANTREKKAAKRVGEVEGKLSAAQKAKLAAKKTQQTKDYHIRAAARAAAGRQSNGPAAGPSHPKLPPPHRPSPGMTPAPSTRAGSVMEEGEIGGPPSTPLGGSGSGMDTTSG